MTRAEIVARSLARKVGLRRLHGVGRSAALPQGDLRLTRPEADIACLKVDEWQICLRVLDDAEYRGLESDLDFHVLSHLLKLAGSGSVVWDIGANVGLYSVFFAKKVTGGTVVAFEPEPQCCERLEDNLALNECSNVRLMRAALGGGNGRSKLELGPGATAGSHRILLASEPEQPGGRYVNVEVRKGDDIAQELAKRGIGPPNLIKVDVEGAELEVLNGALETLSLPDCQAVCCEVHFRILEARGQTFAPIEIEKTLRRAGLRKLRWINRTHLLALR